MPFHYTLDYTKLAVVKPPLRSSLTGSSQHLADLPADST